MAEPRPSARREPLRRRAGASRAARTAALFLAVALLSGVAPAADADAPPGHIRFTAQNRIATANGEFHRWRITSASVDDAHPERSRVEIEIDLASVDTGSERRDDHLRTADFFDVARYPMARVVLENANLAAAGDRFTADVQLELHGKTKRFPMELAIADRAARRIRGRTTLLRSDFEVGAPRSALNPLSIDDQVIVEVEATVPQPASAIPAP